MNLEELSEKAHKLKDKGLSTGTIADEFNVSKQTAKWLISRRTQESKTSAPKDFFIEWDEVGKNSKRINYLSKALADLAKEVDEDIDVVVGIATSGIPLAMSVAEEFEAELSIYLPKKQGWEPDKETKKKGIISPNFSDPSGKKCLLVDDIITTGNTMRESITHLNQIEADSVAASILLDKRGIKNIDGVPIKSLFRVGRVE
ncbi:orotate phosphoribosyltransferase [archaeon SCG-AAA382B04]|nr:orotate phosphoribosyltransferase [archaeon SCG-AAA382B04]